MNKKTKFLTSLFLLSIALSACSRPADTNTKTDEQIVAATATTQANLNSVPDSVPIRADGENFKFAANNTYITYEVLGTVDEIVTYYRTEMEARGWEKKNNSAEEPIGGALTLLRSQPDMNISVTIQSIPDSEYVRVLITVIPK